MPNFSVNKHIVSSPVWVENPTSEPLTWRYNSEYTTFAPGFFRNLTSGELWCMDHSIAVFFQKSLPALVIHLSEPTEEQVSRKKVKEVSTEKSLEEMTMQELRAYGKAKGGVKFRVGITKEEIIQELQAL